MLIGDTMKIEIKERGSKQYYDEFLYIMFRYKDFKKRPFQKAYCLTNCLLVLIFISLIVSIFSAILYFENRNVWYICILILFFLIFIFSLTIYIDSLRRIKYLINNDDTKIINITLDKVIYMDSNQKIEIKWSDIQNVIINRYSICFFTKTTNIVLSTSIKYKENILNAIKKYHKEKLVIDRNK